MLSKMSNDIVALKKLLDRALKSAITLELNLKQALDQKAIAQNKVRPVKSAVSASESRNCYSCRHRMLSSCMEPCCSCRVGVGYDKFTNWAKQKR